MIILKIDFCINLQEMLNYLSLLNLKHFLPFPINIFILKNLLIREQLNFCSLLNYKRYQEQKLLI